MADKTVLREFLAVLGFKIDEAGAKKFLGALSRTTSFAAKTSAAVVGAAAAVEAFVQVFTSGMEDLYYASQRTGAAVKNIQALEYGARQIGIEATDARAALEAMAQTLRMNPGLRALLNNIVGHDTTGQDPTKSMMELVRGLQARFPGPLGYPIAARIAGMFGMDEKTFLMFEKNMNKLQAAEERFHQMQTRAGVDSDKASEAGKNYENTLRDIWAQIVILSQALGVALLPTFNKLATSLSGVIEKFTVWISQNHDLITTRLDQFLSGVVHWVENFDVTKFLAAVDQVIKGVDNVVKVMGGWKNVGIAIGLLTFAPLITAIASVALALNALALSPGGRWVSALLASGATGAWIVQNLFPKSEAGVKAEENQTFNRNFTAGRIKGVPDAGSTTSPAGFPVESPGERLSRYLGTLRTLQFEATHPDAGSAPDPGQIASTKAAIAALRAQGVTPSIPNLSGQIFAQNGGAPNVIINSDVDVNVNGAASPGEVARGVIGGVKSVNADLARNFIAKYQ